MRRSLGLSGTEIAALRETAAQYLRALRKDHTNWTQEDALKEIGAPRTAYFIELAEEAGFPSTSHPCQVEADAVMDLACKGVWSPLVIAEETGIPEVRVNQLLVQCPPPYGAVPFGEAPYGSHRSGSDGKTWVPRKVTVTGQLSYRGHLYCLGKQYRGRLALVREESAKLVVNCRDRPRLELAVRQARKERS